MQGLTLTETQNFDSFLSKNIGLYYFLMKLNLKKYKIKLKMYNSKEEISQIVLIAMWLAWKRQLKYIENGEELPCKYSTMVKTYVKHVLNNMSDYQTDVIYESSPMNDELLYDDTSFEDQDFINTFYQLLTNEQKEVFNNRILDKNTLQECGQKMNKSYADAFLIEKRIQERFGEFCQERLK